jgi:hypothetical protein
MLQTHGSLTILRTSGSAHEQGLTHGRELADRIPTGTVSFFHRFLDLTIANSRAPFWARPLARLYAGHVSRRLAARLPDYFRELSRGISEGSGLPLDELLRAFMLPETFLALVAETERRLPPDQALLSPPLCGCTSVIAARSATADGRILHARNFDYPALGYWERNRVVLFNRPADGMRYVSAISAGIPANGATGMNEAGLCIAIHQHWIDRVDLGGVPVGAGAEVALRHARTIDEAVAIILEHPTVAGFTYLITHGPSRDAVALEVAPGRHGLVRLGGQGIPDTLGYANKYLSPELAGREVPLLSAYWENCENRLRHANAGLAEGRHTPRSLASILGRAREPERGAPRFFGGAVPMPITVQTVVFDPEHLRIWVGDGGAPASHGRFLPFSLEKEGLDDSVEPFETPGFGSAARDAAYGKYLEAYRRYFEQGDGPGALARVREAVELAQDAPELRALAGWLELREGDAAAARASFAHAARGFAGSPGEPRREAEARLGRAIACDLLGAERDWARGEYAALAGDAGLSERVRRYARAGERRPRRARDARAIPIDFTFGAPLL